MSLFDDIQMSAQDEAWYYHFLLMAQYCLENPQNPHCAVIPSYYMYKIDLIPNAIFTGLFAASLVGFALTYALTRRGHAFNIAMMLGVTCEIIGYAGRLMSWYNPWKEMPFLMQICCLTVGPAFLAAGIYFCLRRVVAVYGPQNSRIAPKWYPRIFIPCDLTSLILQAVGGALASVANHNGKSTKTGDNVMIAGLAFQVFTMLVFMLVAGDFAMRTWRRERAAAHAGSDGMVAPITLDDETANLGHLRTDKRFRFFLGALVLSTVCIFWRCVFRVAELSGGWTGPLMERQDLFVGFEGVMIAVAVLALNFFHPAFCKGDFLGGVKKEEKKGGVFEKASTVELVGVKNESTSTGEC